MEHTILDANQELACALFSQQSGLNPDVSSIIEANAKSISVTMNYHCTVKIPRGVEELEDALLKRLEEVGAQKIEKTTTLKSTQEYSFQIKSPSFSLDNLLVKGETNSVTNEAPQSLRGSIISPSSSLCTALDKYVTTSRVGHSGWLPWTSTRTLASIDDPSSPTRKKFRGNRPESHLSS